METPSFQVHTQQPSSLISSPAKGLQFLTHALRVSGDRIEPKGFTPLMQHAWDSLVASIGGPVTSLDQSQLDGLLAPERFSGALRAEAHVGLRLLLELYEPRLTPAARALAKLTLATRPMQIVPAVMGNGLENVLCSFVERSVELDAIWVVFQTQHPAFQFALRSATANAQRLGRSSAHAFGWCDVAGQWLDVSVVALVSGAVIIEGRLARDSSFTGGLLRLHSRPRSVALEGVSQADASQPHRRRQNAENRNPMMMHVRQTNPSGLVCVQLERPILHGQRK